MTDTARELAYLRDVAEEAQTVVTAAENGRRLDLRILQRKLARLSLLPPILHAPMVVPAKPAQAE